MKVTWSASANGISRSLRSCCKELWNKLSRSSLGREGALWSASSFSAKGRDDRGKEKREEGRKEGKKGGRKGRKVERDGER